MNNQWLFLVGAVAAVLLLSGKKELKPVIPFTVIDTTEV